MLGFVWFFWCVRAGAARTVLVGAQSMTHPSVSSRRPSGPM